MAGVYIHIPFCASRCKYCDFYSTTLLHRRTEYVNVLLREIDERREEIDKEPIRTIYFGGGTPSQLPTTDIARLIEAIGADKTEEITVEVNPGDVTTDYLRAIRSAGVNRLSIGIQSFHDERLQLIGRRHTADDARRAVRLIREAGFGNLSLDLIYGLPGQTMEEWQDDLDELLRIAPEHLSAYCLQWEEGTPLMEMYRRGEVDMTDEETETAMFDTLCEQTRKAGYEHYEVSNFAKPGYYSQHNSNYWNNTPYIGIGAAAHSYDGKTRSSNPSDIEQYIQRTARAIEPLSDADRYNERIMLSLRTSKGIPCAEVQDQEAVNKLIAQGLLRKEGEQLVATLQGLHILNRIIEQLMI
ncbi:MAG: radical SAM family heme chaperone HemW [Paludibacteraceae bacterium]|nr:radical SAM family heme chaperone HemW [Paludibacteraceae bacterium]